MEQAYAVASPSLALTKYWGKAPGGVNLPATPSLAITLESLRSATSVRRVAATAGDDVVINGEPETSGRLSQLFEAIRESTGYDGCFKVRSSNNFPTAAGFASSASGVAALTTACLGVTGTDPGARERSRLARIGSGSAARSVYGGFVLLPAGGQFAEPIFGKDHWPSLRLLAVALVHGKKPISSRDAMKRTAATSPYYQAWLADAGALTQEALQAVEKRDLPRLGAVARESYMRMFSTMLSAAPPILYWRPESVALLHLLEELRGQGLEVWETMDAGPQVKILLEEESVAPLREAIEERFPEATTTLSALGDGARILSADDLTPEERAALEAGD